MAATFYIFGKERGVVGLNRVVVEERKPRVIIQRRFSKASRGIQKGGEGTLN